LQGNAMVLFGTSKDLSPLEPNSYVFKLDNADFLGANGSLGYQFGVYKTVLEKNGFKSGDKIYVQAFGSNIAGSYYSDLLLDWVLFPSYLDITSGKYIYTCFG